MNYKQIQAVKFFLDAGADTNVRGLHGMTALNEAVFYNSPQLVALLLERGADPNVGDDAGTLPLWFAVDGFSIESVKLLLRANCNFDTQSSLSNYCGPCNPVEHSVHKRKELVLRWIVSAYCEEAVNILRKHLPVLEKMTTIEDVMKCKVREIAGSPGSLMEHCRKHVRKTFGSGGNIQDKIKLLKLPTALQDYLLFSDFDMD